MSPLYLALKTYGFSPAKAQEIILDHERGDKYASAFVDLATQAYENRRDRQGQELAIERTQPT